VVNSCPYIVEVEVDKAVGRDCLVAAAAAAAVDVAGVESRNPEFAVTTRTRRSVCMVGPLKRPSW
jgi:hypothetical protein